MKYSLGSLLLAEGHPGSAGAIGGAMLGLGLVAVGIFILVTPAKHILQSDRRTGDWLYQRELKASGDEKRAVAAAAVFYKMFRMAFLILGTVFFLGCVVSALAQKTP